MANPYHALFYALYRTFREGESRENAWKVILLLSVAEFLLLAGAVGWLEMVAGTHYVVSYAATPQAKLVVLAVGASIVALNHRALLRRQSWKPYGEKFERYSVAKRTIGSAVAWLAVLLAFGVAIYSL